VVLLVVLTAVWSWWAVKQGAFFETVQLPGTIVLCAAAILIAVGAPAGPGLRQSPAAIVALASLTALGCWTALSAVWSPAPDLAIEAGQRVLTYALAFGLGMWLCRLLGHRVLLAMAPLAVAGAFAGVVTATGLLTGHHPRQFLNLDGTLEYPFDYRNATGAFFLIAFWPALGLARQRATPWWLRATALGAATLCLDLAILSQSRASLIAGAAALCVYAALSRDRARAVVWLTLAVLPALLTVPAVKDLYQTVNAGHPLHSVTSEMHTAGRAAVLTSGLALCLGLLGVGIEARIPISRRAQAVANRLVSVGLVVAVLGASVAFVAAVGDPVHWLGEKLAQFGSNRHAELSRESTRFVLNAETQRGELWRVALLDARHHPLLGDGAGGYRYSYLRERRPNGIVAVHDAHSVELENLSELGVPGLLLLVSTVVGAGTGALRARRLGPAPMSLSAVALAAGAYWLVHASLDWFWPYPGVTAPVFALLGSACAPALGSSAARTRWRRGRALLVAGTALLALSAVPPFLSARYLEAAYAEWPSDVGHAYDDLDRARSLNPLSVDPLLAEGAIAKATGDRRRAIDAFQDATAKRPEEWVSYYNLALLHRHEAPRLARRELAAARERDPHNAELASLASELRGSGG
jgi:O-antigen ligase/polysaccharide polymerase Wzy-like membrane protein